MKFKEKLIEYFKLVENSFNVDGHDVYYLDNALKDASTSVPVGILRVIQKAINDNKISEIDEIFDRHMINLNRSLSWNMCFGDLVSCDSLENYKQALEYVLDKDCKIYVEYDYQYDPELTKFLCDYKSDVFGPYFHNFDSFIKEAIDFNDVNGLKLFLNKNEYSKEFLNEYGWKLIGYCMENSELPEDSKLALSGLLSENGANIDYQDPDKSNMTLLMKASVYGTVEDVNLLLKIGANKYLKDTAGRSAWDMAGGTIQEDVPWLSDEDSE